MLGTPLMGPASQNTNTKPRLYARYTPNGSSQPKHYYKTKAVSSVHPKWVQPAKNTLTKGLKPKEKQQKPVSNYVQKETYCACVVDHVYPCRWFSLESKAYRESQHQHDEPSRARSALSNAACYSGYSFHLLPRSEILPQR